MTLEEEAKRCFQWRWALICSSFVPTSMNLNWNGRPILYASTRATLMSCTTICQMWVLWNTYIMNSSLYCSVSFVSIADPRFVIQYLSIGKHWAPRCLFVIQWHLCYGSFEKYLPKPKFHKSYFEQHLQLCRPGKKRYFQGLLLLSSLYLTVNPRLHKSW